MKNTLPLIACLVSFAAAVCPIPTTRGAEVTPATGTVEGRVFNAATGAALVNARVTVDDTDRQAITDASGTYRLTGVPGGVVRLSVFYIGLAPTSASISVAPNSIVRHEFELRRSDSEEIVQLAKFKVVEDSEMSAQAVAMNEQRFAPNLKHVVALDEFGDRGHENVGEFLHFLPGVAVDVPGDSGPASISLRGFPASNSGVMLDGGSVAGARSDTRAVDLHDVAMGNVSRVEVTKVPTPDMPASGLGGTVNLITKSGFENKQPVLAYQVYTLFNSSNGVTFDGGRRNQTASISPRFVEPSFSVSYLRPVNKKLAISLSASRTWRMKSHADESRDEIPTWNLVDGFQRTSAWQAPVQLYKSEGGELGADWRISDTDTLSAGFQYKKFSMDVHRSRMDVNYGAGATGNADFTQGAATGVGTATQGTGTEYEHKTKNRHFTLKYRHNGPVWRLNGSGSYSVADYARGAIDHGYFTTVPSTIPNLIIRGEGIPSSGGIPTRYTARARTGEPVDIYDGGNYSINTAASNPFRNNTETMGGRIDLARDFAQGVPITLKVGVAGDRMKRDNRAFSQTWTFRPNGSADVTARLARNFNVFDEAFIANAPKVFGVPLRDISMRKVFELYQAHPDWFVLDEPGAYQNRVNASAEFRETISAAYVRSDVRLLKNRIWVVAGVRFEKTELEGRGPLDDLNAQYQRAPNGDFLRNAAGQRILITNDALALRRLRFQERGAHGAADYSGFYPSINTTYNVSDYLVVRAAYARTLGRPDIGSITPGTTISDPDVATPTITVNNPALIPWTADNFDLSLESYNFKDGFGSIGVFRKDIKNFFGSIRTPVTPELLAFHQLPNDGSFTDYVFATQENAGDARITGLEFNYRQSLTFLPNWARGVQVFFNATKLKLGGGATADFTGFNPSKVAAGINLIRPRYFIKLTYSYQGETRRGAVGANVANGVPASTYNYQGERTRWGVSTQYSVSKRLSVYASIMDIGGFKLLNRQYAPSTPEYARGNRIQELGYYTTIGIKGAF